MIFELDIEQKKPLILIVDDIPDNLYILGMALKKNNFEISIVTESKTTMDVVREINPDIILLDILMPEMDGYEVCTLLKADVATKDIPVIFLTAKSNTDDILKGFKTGASDYIVKPFSIQEAIARVMTHIELKRQRDMNLQYIEKLKLANEMLSNAEKELTDLNASKDKFFSIISHDLRNPFQGFIGLTDLVMAEFDDFSHDELKDVVGEINNSAKRLNKLLDNLLTWARLQNGRIVYSPENLNLNSICEEIISMFMELAAEKRISISQNIDKEMTVFADKFMIETVLRNILSNAIKFTHPEGQIDISAQSSTGFNIIKVRDNGIGMSDDEIFKIFRIDSDFTRIGTNNETGTGLGLILCKDLIEKNNGRIEVDSIKGIGTTFSVNIPPAK